MSVADSLLVMIVDDSEVVREWTIEMLQQIGLHGEGFSTTSEALSSCRERLPDAVIVGTMSGAAPLDKFVNELRGLSGERDVKVIVATRQRGGQEISHLIGKGANELLLKPYDTESLRGRLQLIGVI